MFNNKNKLENSGEEKRRPDYEKIKKTIVVLLSCLTVGLCSPLKPALTSQDYVDKIPPHSDLPESKYSEQKLIRMINLLIPVILNDLRFTDSNISDLEVKDMEKVVSCLFSGEFDLYFAIIDDKLQLISASFNENSLNNVLKTFSEEELKKFQELLLLIFYYLFNTQKYNSTKIEDIFKLLSLLKELGNEVSTGLRIYSNEMRET